MGGPGDMTVRAAVLVGEREQGLTLDSVSEPIEGQCWKLARSRASWATKMGGRVGDPGPQRRW